MTNLVIGARGSIGRHVLDHLRAAGAPVRASVRDLGTAGDLPAGVPVVVADLAQPATLPAALEGVRNVFVYANSKVGAFAEVARAAGVEHVVAMSSGSVLLPWTGENAIAKEHREIEYALTSSGLRLTPIRPLVLATNALNWKHSIRRDGTVPIAFPDGTSAPIHERDIAAVAAAALLGSPDASDGLLTGPELISHRLQVELIGEAIGRPLEVVELSPDDARTRFRRFMPAEEADAVMEFLARSSPVTGIAAGVLGRAPLSFRQWAVDHKGDFA